MEMGERHLRAGGALCLAMATLALVLPSIASAVVNDIRPASGNCPFRTYDSFSLSVNLSVVGVPVANSSVKLDAANATIVAHRSKGQRQCDPLIFRVTAFQWSVNAPPGQAATIANGGSLSPTVTLGGAGNYMARLTVCPARCRLKQGTTSRTVGPFVRDVVIAAAAEAPPPPETKVTTPDTMQDPSGQGPRPSYGFATRLAKCAGFGAGFTKAEWVTTQRFGGPGDYRLVEGPLDWSRVADLDNPLNHSSEDFEWKVLPDAPYAGLAQGESTTKLKSEWETGSLPSRFWPTPPRYDHPPDRTSVYGYWIIDCGHPNHLNTELHPPVGVATQRPRPIQIPQSFRPQGFPNGFGSNVWVPGVVTDIWFNRNSGRGASCVRTSLHQPFPRLPHPAGCISNPHSLNRRFTFNVYLPLSPQQRARQLGRSAPATPLFKGIEKLSGGTGGPDPVIEELLDANGTKFLRVTVDLTGSRDATYARRLTVGWAYPSPDNWGANRWRITLHSLEVLNDSEPFPFDHGDWRFYFNTNNRDQEWTELFSCDGCIEERTYPLNVSTGRTGGSGRSPTRSRNLGPDPVVFPGQPLLVHTTGYDDEVKGDDVGTVVDARPQQNYAVYISPSTGADDYRLRYSINSVGSVGPANLTPEASALLRAYTGGGTQCGSAGTLALADRPPECEPTRQEIAFGRKPMVRAEQLSAFESEAEEGPGQALMDLTPATMRRQFNALSAKDRGRILHEINAALRRVPGGLRGDFNELVVTLDRALPKTLVQRALPITIRRSVARYRQRARQAQARAGQSGIVDLSLGQLSAGR